jgi:hypothetical protein
LFRRKDKELDGWYREQSTEELLQERREVMQYLEEIRRQLNGTSDTVPRGAMFADWREGRIRARKELAAIDRELKRRGRK